MQGMNCWYTLSSVSPSLTQQQPNTKSRFYITLTGPQSPANDPYESPPSTSPGCHIGVASLPASTYGYQHLTYGIVSDVLQGLWLYLYRGERFTTAIFEVADDQFGSVGVGKVSEQRPFVEGGG